MVRDQKGYKHNKNWKKVIGENDKKVSGRRFKISLRGKTKKDY